MLPGGSQRLPFQKQRILSANKTLCERACRRPLRESKGLKAPETRSFLESKLLSKIKYIYSLTL